MFQTLPIITCSSLDALHKYKHKKLNMLNKKCVRQVKIYRLNLTMLTKNILHHVTKNETK